MKLKDILIKKKKEYKNRVHLALEEVTEDARFFAPRGHSDQLRSGIDVKGVIVSGNNIKGLVVSSAISSSGFEYAGKQHDQELYHATPENMKATKSFIDYSTTGNTSKQRYQSGYYNFKGFKYATEYLMKGYLSAKPRVITIINGGAK